MATRRRALHVEPGTYELYCDTTDHVARGMVATLTVTEPPPAAQ